MSESPLSGTRLTSAPPAAPARAPASANKNPPAESGPDARPGGQRCARVWDWFGQGQTGIRRLRQGGGGRLLARGDRLEYVMFKALEINQQRVGQARAWAAVGLLARESGAGQSGQRAQA